MAQESCKPSDPDKRFFHSISQIADSAEASTLYCNAQQTTIAKQYEYAPGTLSVIAQDSL